MRKENSNTIVNTAVAAVNVVILAVIMAKTCKPIFDELTDLATQFNDIKRKEKIAKTELQKITNSAGMTKSNQANKIVTQKMELKQAKKKIIEDAETVIGPLKPLVEQSMSAFTIDEIIENNIVSQNVKNYISEKIIELEKTEITLYQKQPLLAKAKVSTMEMENKMNEMSSIVSSSVMALSGTIVEPIDNKIGTFPKKKNFIDGISSIVDTLSDRFNYMNFICSTAVVVILLTTLGMDLENIKSADTAIIEDMEDYWTDFIAIDNEIGAVMNVSLNEVQKDYKIQFYKILAQEGISMDTKLDEIISSEITSTINVFDFIFEMKNTELTLTDRMEKIANCTIATFEEKFDFISEKEELTNVQKIWYILLIPNVTYEKVYQSLLTLDGVTEEEIIENTIRADIVPFTTLFNTLLKQENLDKEKFAHYLDIYDANYNTVTLEEKFSYVQGIQQFSEEEKADCAWELLKGDLFKKIIPNSCGLTESEQFILEFYGMNFNDYLALYDISFENQTKEQQMVFRLFEIMFEAKAQYVTENYDFESESQYVDVIGGVAAEGDKNYYDLYYVSNDFFNRITDSRYVEAHGTNPYEQFIANKQFSVYADGSYKLYISSDHPAYIKQYVLAELAFCNMFYAAYEGIEHNWTEFRSSGTIEFSNNQAIDYITNCTITKGNRYGGRVMNESSRIIYDNLLKEETVEICVQNIPKREIILMEK